MGGGKVQHGRYRGGLFLSCFSAEETGEARGGEDGRLLDAGKGSLSDAWESYRKTSSARATWRSTAGWVAGPQEVTPHTQEAAGPRLGRGVSGSGEAALPADTSCLLSILMWRKEPQYLSLSLQTH